MTLQYTSGERCQQIGRGKRTGTIISDLWSGYVTVAWDSGLTETHVHISDIRRVSDTDSSQEKK